MEIKVSEVIKEYQSSTIYDYLVIGVICRTKSLFADKLNIIRNADDLKIFLDESSVEYQELLQLINIGYTIILRNSVTVPSYSDYESYLTPISDNKVISTYCDLSTDKLRGKITNSNLTDFRELEYKTYVLEIYNLPDVDKFIVNIPEYINKYVNIEDDEFVINSFYLFNIGNTIEVTNDINNVSTYGVIYFNNYDEDFNIYNKIDAINEIPKLISDRSDLSGIESEIISDGNIIVYYNKLVNYIPKNITGVNVKYGLSENRRYLSKVISKDTITYKSKLLGNVDNLRISLNNGLLKIELGNIHEEFEVTGDSNDGNFIGDINSQLVEIILNDGRKDYKLYNFDTNFLTISDLTEVPIDIDKSISYLTDTDLSTNFILLSDTLISYDSIPNLDNSEVRLLVSAQSESTINLLKLDTSNAVKFTGYLDSIPMYTQFLDILYKCNFIRFFTEVPKYIEDTYEDWEIYSPKIVDFYNILELFSDDNSITIFHELFISAISHFILRYKYSMLFKLNPILELIKLLNLFKSKFSIINDLRVVKYTQNQNHYTVELSTTMISILKYNKVTLNFNIEI